MAARHLIIGGGTAGLNAIRTIREEDGGASEITLVSAERPYSRMVLPYYLGATIAESHVYTATPASLAAWKVKATLGRRAKSLDTAARKLTLDDGSAVEYDDCLIATGSRAARPPIPGAEGPGVHSFWTLEEARAVIAGVQPGTKVVMVGAGFISFTILNAILARGASLTIVEVAPRILPRMVDPACARIVAGWLERHGVTLRVGATMTKIEEWKGKRKLSFKKGEPIFADVVIMATGIRTNLEWLEGSGIEVSAEPGGGILVDDHLRSSVKSVYAAGDVARGPNLLTGILEVHAIEPTAQEHGRVVGANMAGRDLAYRGSLIMNIVEVCHLDVASKNGCGAVMGKKGEPIFADVVIMATGIRTNLEWLEGSGIEVSAEPGGGILVDDHLRSSVKSVYAAGDVARGPNLLTGTLEVHAIEPTAQEHGRVVGANMAGRDLAYRGSLIMNIVEVCHLDVASFGQWDDPKADVFTATQADRSQYRKLLFRGGKLNGAMICGPAEEIWATNDVGMLKGLVYSGADLSRWKAHLKKNPFDIKPAYLATHTAGKLLPQTVLGRASQSPQLPHSVMVQ